MSGSTLHARAHLERIKPYLREKSATACDAVLSGHVAALDDALRAALQDSAAALSCLLQAQPVLNLREVLDVVWTAVESHVGDPGVHPCERFCNAARTVFEYTLALLAMNYPCH